tara:strand:- start:55 stop:402 length:348 start_codon:yes stop_codon:yes gene_type:complete
MNQKVLKNNLINRKMEVTGKLIKILNKHQGTTQAGKDWIKQDFVIETDAKFNPEICFTLFGEEKAQMLTQNIGDILTVQFNLSSREYKGKYYTQANAWKIDLMQEEIEVKEDLPF